MLTGGALAQPNALLRGPNTVTLNATQTRQFLAQAATMALEAEMRSGADPRTLAQAQSQLNTVLREMDAQIATGQFNGVSIPRDAVVAMSSPNTTDPLPGTPPPADSGGPVRDPFRDFQDDPNNMVTPIFNAIGTFICAALGIPPVVCDALFSGGGGSSADGLLGMVGIAQPFQKEMEDARKWATHNTIFGGNGATSSSMLARYADRYGVNLNLAPLSEIEQIRGMREQVRSAARKAAHERIETLVNDPYQARTEVSKHASPLTMLADLQTVIGSMKAAEYNDTVIAAEAQSLEARATTELLAEDSRRTLERTLQQSTKAVEDVRDAKEEAAARMMVGLMAEHNSLQAVNAMRTLQALEQVIKATDANTTTMAALLQTQLDEQQGAAFAAQAAASRVLGHTTEQSFQAAASVQMITEIPEKTRIDYDNLTMPVPPGQRNFLR